MRTRSAGREREAATTRVTRPRVQLSVATLGRVSSALSRVVCIIPAKDEQDRIAATVTAAGRLPAVSLVIVCADGSKDDTASRAAAAGAIVVSHSRNRGKAAAVESSVNALGVLESRD